jgi:twitching motility protein PilT
MVTMKELLEKLIQTKASDLHIMAGLRPALRIDGELKPLTEYPELSAETAKELIYSLLTEDQKRNFESDPEHRYELDFGYGIAGLGRFRINIHKQRGTIAGAFRALATSIPKLSELGLPESIGAFVAAKKGLVLVTGPTGCGKSTTLAAIIDTINSIRSDHIITIEDPIEYVYESKKSYITQREVGYAADTLTFKHALKYTLRQDPDVILVGEMRDRETVDMALSAAETGHLVLGTLHTTNATQTVERIVDFFPSDQHQQIRSLLASNLVGVICQMLLPRIDQPGRCLASEVLIANFAIRNNIRSGKSESMYQTLQTSAAEGMQTMDQSLLKLCKERKIDYETAKPFIYDKATHETLKVYSRPAARQT